MCKINAHLAKIVQLLSENPCRALLVKKYL